MHKQFRSLPKSRLGLGLAYMRFWVRIWVVALLAATMVPPLVAASPAAAASGDVATVAGGGFEFMPDGVPAKQAELESPWGVEEASGELFVSDERGDRVYRVDAGGTLTRFAGGGTVPLGDGGPATAAVLSFPDHLAFDAAGNLYIADDGNDRVRRVDVATGTVTTVAGGGSPADGVGDGLPATEARLPGPTGLAFDPAGNLYVSTANRVRRVDHATGVIATVAGTGESKSSGDSGPASAASLCSPRGITFNPAGDLYIAEASCNEGRIRKIDHATGVITTVAGGALNGVGDGGPATAAGLSTPISIAFDSSGNLFIATILGRVRMIDANGIITTVAGGGAPADGLGDGGPATAAKLARARGVAVDAGGNIFVSDSQELNHERVRRVERTSGVITTVAGTGAFGFSGDGRPATLAQLNLARGLAFNAAGDLFLSDAANHRVRKVDRGTGIITTVAGGGLGDGLPAPSAALDGPRGMAVDGSGDVLIADCINDRVRKVDLPSAVITTVAGGGTPFDGLGDGGPATAAVLDCPSGLHTVTSGAAAGTLYIADANKHRVRRVDPRGTMTTVAGTGTPGFSGDGAAATAAQLNTPTGVHLDPAGNLLIADSGNNRVRKVDPSGKITTVAGNGEALWGANNVAATKTSIVGPSDVTHDPAGNLLIAESGLHRLRRLSPAGIITTIAGNGIPAYGGDGGPAYDALLNAPTQLDLDMAGNLFFTDRLNAVVRRMAAGDPAPPPSSGCGQLVTRNLTLTGDLGPCPGDGLVVGADDITINLNGYRVLGTDGPTNGVGIRLTGRKGVTVKGAAVEGRPAGTVSGFGAGIAIIGGSKNTVEGVEVRDNFGPASTFEAIFGDGIGLFFSSDNKIMRNVVANNGIYDGIAVVGVGSHRNLISNNQVTNTDNLGVRGPVGMGIILNPFLAESLPREASLFDNQIVGNTVRDNANSGISNISNVNGIIVDNVVETNGRASRVFPANGIGVQANQLAQLDTNVLVQGNRVIGNGSVTSTGAPFQGDGINIVSSGNRVLNNEVHANKRSGIDIANRTRAKRNEIRNNNAANNGAPGPSVADLYDDSVNPVTRVRDCDQNTWFGNIWGSGGFSPECTATGGHAATDGPSAASATETSTPQATTASEPTTAEASGGEPAPREEDLDLTPRRGRPAQHRGRPDD